MAERVGFIGLGIMGKPMAGHLLSAGYEVVAHSRTRSKVDDLCAAYPAATAASSPREVAEQSTIVITMLPDTPDVQSVMFGGDGLAGSLQPGSLYIDMSTISPAAAADIAGQLSERGVASLDAPVSGGEAGAINAALSIMVGGSQESFDRAMPLFEVMGKTIVLMGGPGAGQTTKACNQIMVALHYAAASEALVLGAKAGVDPAKMVQVLGGGLAASRVLELKGQKMIDHDFQPGFRIDLHRKDLAIALAAGKTEGVPLLATAVVDQLFQAAAAAGRGSLDHSALMSVYEDMARFAVSRIEVEE
ncbi:MAG: 2-hydroxy-3-oxopropionate reductase [Thermomicrobiales bacterium]|nr:2-hydroxy-3-oxopropionate reductase [Thermomicrobiales bacterium]